MKCYPMLVVSDVEASSRWYQEVLGLASGHGGVHFEMLMDGDELALCLHHPDVSRHPVVPDPAGKVPGAGVLVYFTVDDVHAVFERAVAASAEIFEEPHENQVSHAVEFSMRDPDGYPITISKPFG